ncbi:hypothetical protein ACFWHW_21245 [Streptomyces pharetrae]|uniref:hypothetical protein n=1 Tax=Streptomyces pharetrae TaxID=291370 RepID=UPI00365B3C18
MALHQAANDCWTALTLKALYQEGTEGLCHTLPAGTVTTTGEAYLGSHGHAQYVALRI